MWRFWGGATFWQVAGEGHFDGSALKKQKLINDNQVITRSPCKIFMNIIKLFVILIAIAKPKSTRNKRTILLQHLNIIEGCMQNIFHWYHSFAEQFAKNPFLILSKPFIAFYYEFMSLLFRIFIDIFRDHINTRFCILWYNVGYIIERAEKQKLWFHC